MEDVQILLERHEQKIKTLERNVLLLGHKLFHIILIQAVIQRLATLQGALCRFELRCRIGTLTAELRLCVQPFDYILQICCKLYLRLNCREKNFAQIILSYAYERTTGRIIGMTGTNIGVPELFPVT